MARQFVNANADVVTLADESAFDRERTDPFSMFGIVRINDAPAEDAQHGLWGKRGAATFEGYGMGMYGASGSTQTFLQVNIRKQFADQIVVRTDVETNEGSFIPMGFTYNGNESATGVKIYVGGIQESSWTPDDSLTSSILHDGAMKIGTDGGGTGNVEIAEWAFWDVELTAAEVAILGKFFSPLFVRPQSLISYLPLLGNTSPEPDIVGGHNGTLTGTTKVEHSRIYVPEQESLVSPVPETPIPSYYHPAAFIPGRTLATGFSPNHMGLASDGRRKLHYIYRDGTNVQYQKSVNEGDTWSAAVTIATGVNEIQLNEPIAVLGRYVHVVYCKDSRITGQPPKICYRRSTDKGLTWSSEVILHDGTGVGNDRFPRGALIVYDNYVHYLWSTSSGATFVPTELQYRRSTDYGATWEAETKPFQATATGAGRPDMIYENGILHICWTDIRHGSNNNGGEPYYGRSEDNGATWTAETRMATTGFQATARSTIAASGDILVYIYQDPQAVSGGTDQELFMRRSTDGGDTWNTVAKFATGTNSQEHANVVAQDELFAVCWTSHAETPHTTYFRYSKDFGATWTTQQKVATPASDVGASKISITERCMAVMEATSLDGVKLWLTPLFVDDPKQDTLLEDWNRADDSTPPPGTNWGLYFSTSSPGAGHGLHIISNEVAKGNVAAEQRQGNHWLADKAIDVDVVVELTAVSTESFSAVGLGARFDPTGSTTRTGYYVNAEVDPGAASSTWALLRYNNGSTTTMVVTGGFEAISIGDLIAFTVREDMIISWHKPSGGNWQQTGAQIDTTYNRKGKVGIDLVETTPNQAFRITNFWVTELVPNFRSSPPLMV